MSFEPIRRKGPYPECSLSSWRNASCFTVCVANQELEMRHPRGPGILPRGWNIHRYVIRVESVQFSDGKRWLLVHILWTSS